MIMLKVSIIIGHTLPALCPQYANVHVDKYMCIVNTDHHMTTRRLSEITQSVDPCYSDQLEFSCRRT